MTLPTFVGIGAGSESAPTWPAGHAIDDYGLLGCENHTLGTTLSTPSGWTLLCRVPHPITSSVLTVFGRFATSTSEGSPSLSADADHRWGRIVAYRGVNKANPVHSISTATMINASSANCPGISTDLDDCMIVWIMAYAFDNAGPVISAQSQSQCGSVTERGDDGTVTGSGGGVTFTDGTLASKGSINAMSCTWGGTSAECATIALQAADKTFGSKTLLNLGRHGMAIPCKQSTAQSFRFFMCDSADGKTGKTGLTLAVSLQKEGDTSFSSISPTVTEIGSGHYNSALTTTHMNTVGLASLRATATGADPADCPNCVDVVAYDKASATRGTAGTALPPAAAEDAGGLYTRGTGAGQINQNANGQIDARAVAESLSIVSKIDAVGAKTTNLPSDPADQSLIIAATDAIITALASLATAAALATAKTAIDAIKLKTDQLAFTVANQVDANALTGGGGGGMELNDLLGYEYADGRTIVGFFRRVGSSVERARGLKGTLVEFLTQAGDVIWSIAQSATAGTRGTINLGNTEDPP